MTALTITNVDTGDDRLDITGHGLLTGDGPVAIYTESGAIPAGLSPATDYWVIRVDANSIRLSSSSANANANTPINITSAGSGTLLLLVGIPYRRARTYVPRSANVAGSQIKSADLNALQDSFVALWNLLTGQAQSLWTGIKLAANQHVQISGTGQYKHGDRTLVIPASAFVADANNTRLSQNGYQTFNAAAIAYAPIPLPPGKRIKGITVYFDPQGAASVTPALIRRPLASFTRTAIWSGSAASSSGLTSQSNASVNYTLLSSETYEVEVGMTGAGNRLHCAVVTFDEP